MVGGVVYRVHRVDDGRLRSTHALLPVGLQQISGGRHRHRKVEQLGPAMPQQRDGLVGEAAQLTSSGCLRDADARACRAAQRERRRTEAGGIEAGGETTQPHDVQRGGGGSAEREDVPGVGRTAVVCEKERA